ncbi:MAG: hypothetical protein ACRDGM_06600, partial [bacterium]
TWRRWVSIPLLLAGAFRDESLGLFEGDMDEIETPLDPMTCPKMPCKCGRLARVHPETGKAWRHRPSKKHPAFFGAKRKYRKGIWCPEVA